MMELTGFGDEISPDLTEQLNVLETAGINYLDFRSVWGKSVVELNEHEITIIKEELDKRKFRVSSIASPIGKTGILEDFSSQLNDLDKVITLAKTFDTAYIRVFIFHSTRPKSLHIQRGSHQQNKSLGKNSRSKKRDSAS
jgi:hypothetical protein